MGESEATVGARRFGTLEKVIAGVSIAVLALGFVGVQVVAVDAVARDEAAARAEHAADDASRVAWESAIDGVRTEANAGLDDVRSAGATLDGLGDDAAQTALDDALVSLDTALEGRNIAAADRARDAVDAAVIVLAQSVAVELDAAVNAASKAGQPEKDAVATRATDIRVALRGAADTAPFSAIVDAFDGVKDAADAVAASHAAVEEAERVAAEAARAVADAPAESTSSTGSGTGTSRDDWQFVLTPVTFVPAGDYRPGCPTNFGGYSVSGNPGETVVIDPGYPYTYGSSTLGAIVFACDFDGNPETPE